MQYKTSYDIISDRYNVFFKAFCPSFPHLTLKYGKKKTKKKYLDEVVRILKILSWKTDVSLEEIFTRLTAVPLFQLASTRIE